MGGSAKPSIGGERGAVGEISPLLSRSPRRDVRPGGRIRETLDRREERDVARYLALPLALPESEREARCGEPPDAEGAGEEGEGGVVDARLGDSELPLHVLVSAANAKVREAQRPRDP